MCALQGHAQHSTRQVCRQSQRRVRCERRSSWPWWPSRTFAYRGLRLRAKSQQAVVVPSDCPPLLNRTTAAVRVPRYLGKIAWSSGTLSPILNFSSVFMWVGAAKSEPGGLGHNRCAAVLRSTLAGNRRTSFLGGDPVCNFVIFDLGHDAPRHHFAGFVVGTPRHHSVCFGSSHARQAQQLLSSGKVPIAWIFPSATFRFFHPRPLAVATHLPPSLLRVLLQC